MWNDTVIDTSGKFVPLAVFHGVFGATWVDYVDAAAANDARNDAGHRVITVWDGVEYFMNDRAAKTLQGQADIVGGVPAVAYTVDGAMYITY